MWRRKICDFGSSIALVIAATLIIYFVSAFAGPQFLLWLYLAPIVFAKLRSGWVLCLITAVLCGFTSDYFFYEPSFSFRIDDPQERNELVAFATLTIVIAWLVSLARDLQT